MVDRTDIVREAMRLVDAPFHHQGRVPETAGVDCLGVIVVAIRRLGLTISDYACYSRIPNPEQLLSELASRFDPTTAPQFGDFGVCWCHPALKNRPHHAFWLVPGPDGSSRWMVHAMMEVKRVCYNPFADPWPDRVHSFHSVRGLD